MVNSKPLSGFRRVPFASTCNEPSGFLRVTQTRLYASTLSWNSQGRLERGPPVAGPVPFGEATNVSGAVLGVGGCEPIDAVVPAEASLVDAAPRVDGAAEADGAAAVVSSVELREVNGASAVASPGDEVASSRDASGSTGACAVGVGVQLESSNIKTR